MKFYLLKIFLFYTFSSITFSGKWYTILLNKIITRFRKMMSFWNVYFLFFKSFKTRPHVWQSTQFLMVTCICKICVSDEAFFFFSNCCYDNWKGVLFLFWWQPLLRKKIVSSKLCRLLVKLFKSLLGSNVKLIQKVHKIFWEK